MLDQLPLLEPWHWLTFGIALVVIEMLGAGGYLLIIGGAALLTGLAAWVIPGFVLPLQYLGFAGLAVLATLLWWWRQHRRQGAGPAAPLLNQRIDALIGQSFPLLEATTGGRGRIAVGDTSWRVSGPDLPAGTMVTVTGCDGMILTVQPLADRIAGLS